MTKVVSFQVVQGYTGDNSWTPDVVALCEDGSLWTISLSGFQDGTDKDWKRITPEPNAMSVNHDPHSFGRVTV